MLCGTEEPHEINVDLVGGLHGFPCGSRQTLQLSVAEVLDNMMKQGAAELIADLGCYVVVIHITFV